jgi:hypothetical protein
MMSTCTVHFDGRRRFKHIRFAWIPRAGNAECDALAASWAEEWLDATRHLDAIALEI